jgi:hypothetical protein
VDYQLVVELALLDSQSLQWIYEISLVKVASLDPIFKDPKDIFDHIPFVFNLELPRHFPEHNLVLMFLLLRRLTFQKFLNFFLTLHHQIWRLFFRLLTEINGINYLDNPIIDLDFSYLDELTANFHRKVVDNLKTWGIS